jgi:nucleolar protein 12
MHNASTSAAKSQDKAVTSIPKGDPSLGDKLRTLNKQERKAAKSVDPNRVARRLAKKKARNALQRQGVDMVPKSKEKDTSSKVRPSSTKPKSILKGGKEKKRTQ